MEIITIVGARPQFIKAAALSRTIRNYFAGSIHETIVHTGQHYDANMSEVFFEDLQIPRPQHHLGVGSGGHGMQTGRMTEAIEKVLVLKKPDAVVVYGDTNTTLAGALAASKLHIPVVHIEAGLRSFNKMMPEEINRVLTDHVSTLLFSPTETGISNLLKEGFSQKKHSVYDATFPGIFNSGDIMLDNTRFFARLAEEKSNVIDEINPTQEPYVLATVHRPVNTDNPENLLNIVKAFDKIAATGIKVIMPVHPRTRAKLDDPIFQKVTERLEASHRITLSPPVSFLDMIMLEKHARMIITDSGGVQKEAYFLQKPGIIVREETEWKEIVSSGNARLCGADTATIVRAFEDYVKAAPKVYPEYFGDGNAAEFICETLLHAL